MRLRNIMLFLLSMCMLSSCANNNSGDASNNINNTSDLITRIEDSKEKEEKEKNENTIKKEANKKSGSVEEKPEIKEEKDNSSDEKEDIEKKEKKTYDKKEDRGDKNTQVVRIKAFGDIMSHLAQLNYAYNKGAGTYDYSDSFMYIKDFVTDADISVANYETTTNPNVAYAGFPRFNSPPEFLDAIKDAGFDVLSTANNHSLDTEVEGIKTTIDEIEERGLSQMGSNKDGNDKILFKKIGDVNIAFLSYTYGANGIYTLEIVREEVPELNYLHEEKIEADIKKAKKEGADFVVVYPHRGVEYYIEPTEDQINLGKKMIDRGADLIIGNHPHVVEPYEWYKTDEGRYGFIAYALGNLISQQSYESVGNIRTEQSVAYDIKLEKDLDSKDTKILEVTSYPLWVGSTYNDYGQNIRTFITQDFLEGGKYYDEVDENQRERIRQANDDTLSTLGLEDK